MNRFWCKLLADQSCHPEFISGSIAKDAETSSPTRKALDDRFSMTGSEFEDSITKNNLKKMEQIKWFDRPFDCWFGPEYLPGLIERLRETPDWIEEKIEKISDSVLIEQIDGKWSVKQNVGHLTTLEPLWRQRVEDIVDGQKTLTPADLSNKATEEADFNSTDTEQLLLNFSKERSKLITMFENISDADLEKRSQHPRLKQPMRISDHAFFIAEHDIHHIVLINRILYVLTAT